MANWSGGVLTRVGRELQAKVLAGRTKLELTRIKLGSGSETSEQVDTMRDLHEPKASVGISAVEYTDNLCTVTGIVLTSALDQGFYAKEWGLFANDPDEGEILYMISLDTVPDWIPPGSTALTISASYAMTIAVENADNISVQIAPTGLVDVEMLNNIVGVAGRTTAFAAGQTTTVAGLPAMYYLRCVTAGTTGVSSPIISSKVQDGDLIPDGTVVWQVVKAANLSELGYRTSETEVAAGRIAFSTVLPPGWFLECTTAGITAAGALDIQSPVLGDEVTDGTAVWAIRKIGSVDDIPVATDETKGLMSAEDKAKMDSIVIDETGNIGTKSHRWGIRIDKRNSDPATRCEYIFDAKGMGPAGMDFTNGVFNYGDWKDLWFVKNNKPCMLKSDGTVDYYLDPNDYTKKEDGTPSDVGNPNYDGNAMAEIPLVWVKRWEDGRYEYEVISDRQYDETYHAYAHTRADGTIADKFYFSMFGGSGNAAKIRSLSGQSVSQSLTATQQIAGATANGSGWYIHSWSQRELIRTLCVLMGCSTDTQSVFGNGNCRSASSASGLLATGTLKDKGQFYGYNNANQVKVFHVEEFWGNQWDRTAGIINDRGKIYAKMTPEGNGYRVTDATGYEDTGLTAPAGNSSYINEMKCSKFGMIPKLATGSGSTYYCDGYWANNGQLNYLIAGAGADAASAIGGAFAFDVIYAPANANWNVGCGLSYL